MKKKEVKEGLIVNLRGMRTNVRIESDDVNWSSLGPSARPVQYDQSRGVLVRYVDRDGKPLNQGPAGRFVAALQSLILIPEEDPAMVDVLPEEEQDVLPEKQAMVDVLPENQAPLPPTIQTLLELIETLQYQVKALENRTIIEVECKPCKGSGQTQDYYETTPSNCYRCNGIGHTFALSPLEEK